MKKLSILIIIVLTVCLTFSFTAVTAVADTSTVVSTSSDYAEQLLSDFLTECPSRAYDTTNELNAGYYIYDFFDNIGLDVEAQLLRYSTNGNSYNIVATIDTDDTDDTIIIGAHYDAVGEGASDNATGVVALLMIAEQLYSYRDSLQCDIVLIAFAGEEAGLYGSQSYVASMSTTDIANTKLMINIDAIGIGDELMVSGQLTTTDYVDSLIAGASSSDCQLDYKPLSADLDFTIDYYGYGYYETLQNSDQTIFAMSGIPTAILFSGSYDTIGSTYVESTNSANCVMNTTNDTLATLVDSGVDYGGRMSTVANSICNAIITDCATLLDAPNQLPSDGWFNYTAVTITYCAIVIVVIIIAIIYYKKLVRKAIISGQTGGNGAVGINRVFTKPDSEDIFDI